VNIAWKLRSRYARIGALVAAATGLSAAVVAVSAGTPAVRVADGFGPGDGLNRFVVTLADSPAEPGPGGVGPVVAPGAGAADRVDVDALARAQADLGADGRVVAYADGPYYVTDAGSVFVGIGTSAGQSPAAGPASGPDVDAALEALLAHPQVESAQRLWDGTVLVATRGDADDLAGVDGVVQVTESVQVPVAGADPSDPYFAQYGWNLRNTGSNAGGQPAVAGADIDAPAGWDAARGQGVVVAVVDTGFDVDHPDLADALWTNPTEACGSVDTNGNGKAGDCHGWNFYANNADVTNGTMGAHGSTVAGVVAARADNGHGSAGVAPDAVIMPLVVGGGETVDVNLAAEAIRYAADNGADVINASFGGAFSGQALTNLTNAVDYAIGKGVVVVAAAGNDGKDRDSVKVYPANLSNPALITVASTTAADTLAPTSAYGASSVDLAAPGEGVLTTWDDGGYRLVSGTSIAAPHVAAAAALHLSVNPALTPAQVRAALLADADRVPSLTGVVASGARASVAPLGEAVTSVGFTFSQMVATAGAQAPKVAVSSTAGGGQYQVQFGLAMLVDGQVWAVSGEDVTFNGQTATTGDDGLVTFSLGSLPILGARTFEPQLTLGAGSFALSVQVFRDGEALTRPYAAPLTVTEPGQAPNPGTGGGTQNPGTGGGTPNPGTGGGTTDPGTGGGTPNPGTGGGTPNPGTGGGTPNPGTGGGTTDPGTGGGTPNPGTGGGTTDPGTGGGTPNPGTGGGTGGGTPNPGTGGGTPNPGTGGGTGGTPNPGTGGGTTDPGTGGGTPNPGTGGTGEASSKTYDRVGDFEITKISPIRVSTSGGTVVTIRGDALESGLSVRVGSTAVAHVTSSSSTGLVFQAPARVAGTYDVTVYKNGRTSVLTDALIYVDPAPGGGGTGGTPNPGTGGGTTDPGTGGGAPNPGTGGGTGGTPNPGTGGGTPNPGTGGGTPNPGTGGGTGGGTPNPGTGGGTPNPGTGGGAPNPGTGGGTPNPGTGGGTPNPGTGGGPGGTPLQIRIGPNGERLVHSDTFAGIAHLWSLQCTATCTGVQI
jgi:subtilisin family serine protease